MKKKIIMIFMKILKNPDQTRHVKYRLHLTMLLMICLAMRNFSQYSLNYLLENYY